MLNIYGHLGKVKLEIIVWQNLALESLESINKWKPYIFVYKTQIEEKIFYSNTGFDILKNISGRKHLDLCYIFMETNVRPL